MFAGASSANSGASKPSVPPVPPAAHRAAAVEDVDLDDGLDDNELSDGGSETGAAAVGAKKNTMGSVYRKGDDDDEGGGKKMSEVANAISSCTALSFFSISMILANKVCGVWCGVRESIFRVLSWLLGGLFFERKKQASLATSQFFSHTTSSRYLSRNPTGGINAWRCHCAEPQASQFLCLWLSHRVRDTHKLHTQCRAFFTMHPQQQRRDKSEGHFSAIHYFGVLILQQFLPGQALW